MSNISFEYRNILPIEPSFTGKPCRNYLCERDFSDKQSVGSRLPNKGSRKMIPIKTRFAAKLRDRDYICYDFKGVTNTIRELGLRSDLKAKPPEFSATEEGKF